MNLNIKIVTVIVTYNAMLWIERCLNSILNSSISSDIYIVDNGSIDGTQEYICRHYSQVMFVQSQKNLGFGQANNLGLQYALDKDYDYVYLLNQDAWIMPDTLDKLITINQKMPEYGVLSPFQLQGNEQNMDMNFAMNICSYESNSFLINDLYFNRRKAVYDVPNVMAAHWLISRECLFQVGGFSPTFPHYGEDNNYADRVRYHGFKLGIVPSAIAVHDRENRAKPDLKRILYMNYICHLIRLSSISQPEKRPLFCMIVRSFISVVKLKTLKPLNGAYKVLKDYRNIRLNKETSRGRCAFL